MTADNATSGIERLMEFGIGIGIAQQMVKTMNHALNQSVVSGSPQANRNTDQQQFYVVIDNVVGGPWSRQQVQSAMLSGRLGRDSFVWTPGMAQWSRMEDVSYFTTPPVQPPPLPPKGDEP